LFLFYLFLLVFTYDTGKQNPADPTYNISDYSFYLRLLIMHRIKARLSRFPRREIGSPPSSTCFPGAYTSGCDIELTATLGVDVICNVIYDNITELMTDLLIWDLFKRRGNENEGRSNKRANPLVLSKPIGFKSDLILNFQVGN
jgi:hypothetical protein